MGQDRRREAEGAGRRKAQGKSPGERDERRAGAGKGACGRVGLCCGVAAEWRDGVAAKRAARRAGQVQRCAGEKQ